MTTLRAGLICLVLGILVGLGGGYAFYHGKVPVKAVDAGHAAIPLPGGAQVVEEKPSVAPLPTIKVVTKTVEVVREVTVTVKPDTPNCPPVKVTLDLIRNDDNTLRVVAKSEGGEILTALDVPVEKRTVTVAVPAPKVLPWAAGAVYGTTAWGDESKGVFVDRDLSFVRTGVEVTRNTYAVAGRIGWEVRAKVGIRF